MPAPICMYPFTYFLLVRIPVPNFANPSLSFVQRTLLCSLLTVVTAAHAADAPPPATVVEGAGVSISTLDLETDAKRIPAEVRKNMLVRPESVTQMATTLYVFRALAAEAERAGMATDPAVAAAIQIARDRALAEALLARVEAGVKLDDSTLEAYAQARYKAEPKAFEAPEQIRARHILIAKADDARAKADKLLADLKAGAKFEDLASAHSADPGSAAKGGDLGPFTRGKMVKPFEDAAFGLAKPGDLSNVVETQFGYHIIQLVERQPAGLRPFSEVREELLRDSAQKLANDARQQKVKPLLDAAKFQPDAIEAFTKAPH